MHKDVEKLDDLAASVNDLAAHADALLVTPEWRENAFARRYLESIARRAGELARTVNACCYTMTYPKEKV